MIHELIIFVILALLALLLTFVLVWTDDSGFLRLNFFPNFLSNIWAGIIITGLVYALVSISRRVDLRLQVETTIAGDSLSLQFIVNNNGRVILRPNEIYWHVFINQKINVTQLGGTSKDEKPVTINGNGYSHFVSLSTIPAYPGSLTSLATMKANNPEDGMYQIFYYFTTPYGLLPRGVKRDKNAQLFPHTLASISLRFPPSIPPDSQTQKKAAQ